MHEERPDAYKQRVENAASSVSANMAQKTLLARRSWLVHSSSVSCSVESRAVRHTQLTTES
ncbi:hypothetical protein E2C01_043105 [Portunus trituberculatus]|uniref:Uncharacterized protein n=1 Tax=Portunus trituberculatus TaxID=210409 RepID=A0A5B7FV72_PORTR|nr:hypothetical protein [Portunus trituberculatus]